MCIPGLGVTVEPADEEHHRLPRQESEEGKKRQKCPQVAQGPTWVEALGRQNVADGEKWDGYDPEIPYEVLEVAGLRGDLSSVDKSSIIGRIQGFY